MWAISCTALMFSLAEATFYLNIKIISAIGNERQRDNQILFCLLMNLYAGKTFVCVSVTGFGACRSTARNMDVG
jgi:hypothetical protein